MREVSYPNQNFIEGRGGLLIPRVRAGELGPGEFLQFFRDVLRVNVLAHEDSEVDYYYTQAQPSMREFVLPGSEEKQLIVLRYSRSGQAGGYGDSATHEILSEPEEPGSFDRFLKISHPVNLWSLSVTDSSERTQTFYSSKRKPAIFPPAWHDSENRPVSSTHKKILRETVRDFVKLVS